MDTKQREALFDWAMAVDTAMCFLFNERIAKARTTGDRDLCDEIAGYLADYNDMSQRLFIAINGD